MGNSIVAYIDLTDLCKNGIPPDLDWGKYLRNNLYGVGALLVAPTGDPFLVRLSGDLNLISAPKTDQINTQVMNCLITLLTDTIYNIRRTLSEFSESVSLLAEIEKQVDRWDERFKCSVYQVEKISTLEPVQSSLV